jgi:hypothetical protein
MQTGDPPAAVILVQLKPPKSPIQLLHGRLFSCLLADLETIQTNQMLLGRDLFEVMDRPTTKGVAFTIIDSLPKDVSSDAIVGLVELLTARWRKIYPRAPIALDSASSVNQRPRFPRTVISPSLRRSIDKGITLISTQRRFRMAIERWYASVRRDDVIDSVLDLCSSLEACLAAGSNEIRLRLALAVYTTLRRNRSRGFKITYEMYNVRSRLVHGDSVAKLQASEVKAFMEVVADALHTILSAQSIPSPDRLNADISDLFG